jgi:hypothetical protein
MNNTKDEREKLFQRSNIEHVKHIACVIIWPRAITIIFDPFDSQE